MLGDNKRLVEEIFIEVAGAPTDARASLLDARCKGDKTLRAEIASLLSMHDGDVGVLDVPQPLTMGLMKQISGLMRTDDASLPKDGKIGAYNVLRVIGSGGMGVVYLAEQERPRRTVALKVIRRGLSTPSLLRRFEHEAEILGRLQHPGIAQIYEAGVADYGFGPQPYIAMEYIDGRQLLDYAEVNRLGTRARLALVAKVCDAVQHAHQRGVIHRDIKPANVLVKNEDTTLATATKSDTNGQSLLAGVGQPKILDFGVARMADRREQATTMRTNVGQLIGTLAYMSPEQLGSDSNDIDTRSDVYALGVVLYQLLTGKLPYDVANRALPEAVRIIKDEEPTRLSSINKTFRGDLDTIVLKALEKDKNRRYQSSAELAADIQRFLADEPIAAKRDSSMYLLRKQLVRYKGVLVAASVAALTLFAFTVNTIRSAAEYKAVAEGERLAVIAEQAATKESNRMRIQLQEQLNAATVERARLEAATGNVVLAEDLLWSEYFRDSMSTHAYWGLWELYNRNPCVWTLQTPSVVRSAVVNKQKTVIALVCPQAGCVRLLYTSDGASAGTIRGFSARPWSAAFSPTGDQLVVGLDDGSVVTATTSEPATIKPIVVRAQGQAAAAVNAVSWSPNGRYIASGGVDKMINIWDASTFERVSSWQAHPEQVSCLDFSIDSQELVTGSYDPSESAAVKIWSVPSGSAVDEYLTERQAVTAVAYSPDDSKIVFGNANRLSICIDLVKRETRYLVGTFSGSVGAFDFLPDGKKALACGGTTPQLIYMPSENSMLGLSQHRTNVVGGALLTPFSAITVSYDGVVKLWDAKRVPAMSGHGGFKSWCFGTAYSADGSLMAIGAGGGVVAVLDTTTRKRKYTIEIPDLKRTRAVKFVPGTDLLVTGSEDGYIRLHNMATGELVDSFRDGTAEIFSVAVHPNGRLLATGHGDRSVKIWDIATRKRLQDLKVSTYRCEGVAFSPDGSILAASGSTDGAQLWDTSDWTPLPNLEGTAHAWAVAFSPDGTKFAAGTWSDNIDVWDMQTRNRIATLQGHRGLSSTIAFSPDGTLIASGGDDATVRLWDLKISRCVLTLETAHGESTGLSFDPTGRYVTTGCQNHMTLTWDLHALRRHIAGNLEYNKARYMSRIGESGRER